MIWKNIVIKKGINYRDAKEFLNLEEKIDIIPIDQEGRIIIYLNNRLHFYNGIGVITLSDDDILNYDKNLYNLLGKKFCKIILEIFYICGLQIKKYEEKNKLDFIIDRLKKGEYGKINESEYYFLELYSYIRSASFYSRDRSRKITTKNHKHKEDFGGRCLDLLSIKKYIIDGLPIGQTRYHLDAAKLREKMLNNGIPPNPCPHDSNKDVEEDQKNIFDFKLEKEQ